MKPIPLKEVLQLTVQGRTNYTQRHRKHQESGEGRKSIKEVMAQGLCCGLPLGRNGSREGGQVQTRNLGFASCLSAGYIVGSQVSVLLALGVRIRQEY